jgi:transcriptional regulator with XRE-family HTH domain
MTMSYRNIYQKAFLNGRLLLKDSLRKFASRLGINHAFLSRIENGKQEPSYRLLNRLIVLTGYELNDLISGNFFNANGQTTYPTLQTFYTKKNMEINFNEMNAQQRAYLRDKWSAEIKELTDAIAEAKVKLAKRLEKSQLSEGEITALETELQNAQSIFAHLQSTNAPAAMITQQQTQVAGIEARLVEKKQKGGIVSDEEAVLEQVGIDELEWKRQYRENKIAQISVIVA